MAVPEERACASASTGESAQGRAPLRLSVIVPALDEAEGIAAMLAAVRGALGVEDQLIVVDGGSRDATVELAKAAGAEVVTSQRGRGRQMNLGAAHGRGDVLVFVHADTLVPRELRAAIVDTIVRGGADWGRFDIEFDAGGPLLRLIAWLISNRSRLFQSATGDQAIFVRRSVFEQLGGYREELLFEDVDLVQRLRAGYAMGIPVGRVVTSSRRWRNRGVWATTFKMWSLKSLYLLGVPAETLARWYRDER